MQGFNQGRYVPPELEGLTTGNKLHQRRAPGTLRRDGTQTVRFEMPFAVWCSTCRPTALIGQGVRFNAEKKRVGHYFTTPIWSFHIKHAACGGMLEIRTDPKNTRYEVVAGGKARDYGEDRAEVREGEGGVPILTPEEREKRRENAFAQLEGKVEEKGRERENGKRIVELYEAKERDWSDPWTVNRKMRDTFRRERKVRKREEEVTEALKERLGTDIELLPATDEDAKRAALVTFGDPEVGKQDPGAVAKASAMFRTPTVNTQKSTREQNGRDGRKEALRSQLVRNTRAALNPFG